jgi:Flp pilus assembly protein TadB
MNSNLKQRMTKKKKRERRKKERKKRKRGQQKRSKNRSEQHQEKKEGHFFVVDWLEKLELSIRRTNEKRFSSANQNQLLFSFLFLFLFCWLVVFASETFVLPSLFLSFQH